MSEPKKVSESTKVWSIKRVKFSLGKDMCTNILFLHALFDVMQLREFMVSEKEEPWSILRTMQFFDNKLLSGTDPESTEQDVILAGERSVICLYGGKANDSLDSLRYTNFAKK